MCNCVGLKLDRVLADEQWRRFGGLFVEAEMIVSGGPTGSSLCRRLQVGALFGLAGGAAQVKGRQGASDHSDERVGLD
jgi:hypothetical protein